MLVVYPSASVLLAAIIASASQPTHRASEVRGIITPRHHPAMAKASNPKSEGTTPTHLTSISKRAKALLAVADKVNSGSLLSLCKWLDSGAEKLGSIVGDVKDIKKDILKSDAKSKVKADVYVVTTPLIKSKVKVADIKSVFNLHHKRIRNIVTMCNTLQGKKKSRTSKAKKKGGSK